MRTPLHPTIHQVGLGAWMAVCTSHPTIIDAGSSAAGAPGPARVRIRTSAARTLPTQGHDPGTSGGSVGIPPGPRTGSGHRDRCTAFARFHTFHSPGRSRAGSSTRPRRARRCTPMARAYCGAAAAGSRSRSPPPPQEPAHRHHQAGEAHQVQAQRQRAAATDGARVRPGVRWLGPPAHGFAQWSESAGHLHRRWTW